MKGRSVHWLLPVLSVFCGWILCACAAQQKDSREPQLPDMTGNVDGFVRDDDGNALSGVVVSDGFTSVVTDKDGHFSMRSDLEKTGFVFVSTPSGYMPAIRDGVPQYYRKLSDGVKDNDTGLLRFEFVLDRIEGGNDDFTLVMIGDPQPRDRGAGLDKVAYHSLDCCEDLYADVAAFAMEKYGDSNIYAVVLGDIVHENMSLYEHYVDGISGFGFPVYTVMGNHDYDTSGVDDDDAAGVFESWFGPRNYSFNLGKWHIVVLDNIMMQEGADGRISGYTTGISDEVLSWLFSDLYYVPDDTPLMICSHAGVFRSDNGGEFYTSYNGREFTEMVSRFKSVHSWAGHSHTGFNAKSGSSHIPQAEQHVVARATGDLWINDWLCKDGTPRGYVIVDVEGEDISWYFKPTGIYNAQFGGSNAPASPPPYEYLPWTVENGVAMLDGKPLDTDYQFSVYPPGAYGDDKIYVNVFLYDESWPAPVFTASDGTVASFTKVATWDAAYRSIADWYNANCPKFSAPGSALDYFNNVQHLLSADCPDGVTSGTVTVKDRFGNTYTRDVSW